jgi:hypothetical protein
MNVFHEEVLSFKNMNFTVLLYLKKNQGESSLAKNNIETERRYL